MSLLRHPATAPVALRLSRDLVRTIKRGHPWVYAEALRQLPPAPAGTSAILLDHRKGQEIARGLYDPKSPLALRICSTDGKPLDDRWAERRLTRALALRERFIRSDTTGYRLAHGEGDGLPGLAIDRYDRVLVQKFDGPGPEGFWNAEELAGWLRDQTGVDAVVGRRRERSAAARVLAGEMRSPVVPFLENGMRFTADVVAGQKTGFFLDQRDNRDFLRGLVRGQSVLNLFSYTGGFSIAAGVGGASQVTSVDLAAPAVKAAEDHWALNELPAGAHEAVAADAFEYLEKVRMEKRRWDVVVVDPPSFAPSQESVTRATSAYQKLFSAAIRVTANGGLLAAASCSSHISEAHFIGVCEEAVSDARRQGRVITVRSQPSDHPWPLALPEFRYLKFVVLQLS